MKRAGFWQLLQSNNPKGRVPRDFPWVNENSPEGRQAKLELLKCHGLARGYPLVANRYGRHPGK